jgi:lipid-binding SYLF domain-containing protein
MKKAIALAAILSLTSIGWAATDREATNDRLDHAGSVLHEIMAAPDNGIPEEVLEHAKCIAVVPHMLKGGFVFGAENGRGVATCRSANGWSAPMFFAITGGSWGLQIGVEGVDLVMISQASLNLAPTPQRPPGQSAVTPLPIPTGKWTPRSSPIHAPGGPLPDSL